MTGTTFHSADLSAMSEASAVVNHDGQAFEASGAYITADRALVYVGRHINPWFPAPGSADARMLSAGYSVRQPDRHTDRYDATDWHGDVVGVLTETGQWDSRTHGYCNRVYSYRLVLADGREYNVRGSGPGMSASGRRRKASASDSSAERRFNPDSAL